MKLIEKKRNTNGYQNMSKNKLEDLLTKLLRSKIPEPIPRPKIKNRVVKNKITEGTKVKNV